MLKGVCLLLVWLLIAYVQFLRTWSMMPNNLKCFTLQCGFAEAYHICFFKGVDIAHSLACQF